MKKAVKKVRKTTHKDMRSPRNRMMGSPKTKKRAVKKRPQKPVLVDPFLIAEGHITGGYNKYNRHSPVYWFYLQRTDDYHWVIRAGCRVWGSFTEARKHYQLRSWKKRHLFIAFEDAKKYCAKSLATLNWLWRVAKEYDLPIAN